MTATQSSISDKQFLQELKTRQQSEKLIVVASDFSFLPGKVDVDDIESNGKLITQEEMDGAKAQMKQAEMELAEAQKEADETARVSMLKKMAVRVSMLKKSKEYQPGCTKRHYTVIKMTDPTTEDTDPVTKKDRYYAIYKGQKHKKTLGAGAFGTVKLMQDLETGEWYAMKVIDYIKYTQTAVMRKLFGNNLSSSDNYNIINELVKIVLKVFFNPTGVDVDIEERVLNEFKKDRKNGSDYIGGVRVNQVIRVILSCVDSFDEQIKFEQQSLKTAHQSKGFMFREGIIEKGDEKKYKCQAIIGMKLASGNSLEKFTERQMPMSRWLSSIIAICQGIKGLHKMGLYHCDIKENNILFNPNTNEATPVDLGLSVSIHQEFTDPRGTPGYMAPEVRFAGFGGYIHTEQIEVYALGKTIARLLKLTEDVYTDDGYFDLIIVDKSDCPISDPGLRKLIVEYLHKMTAIKPEDRPSLNEAIKFFTDLDSNLINVLGQFRKVGILNIDEYQESDKSVRENMRSALKNYDEVYLVSKSQLNSEGADIKKHLEIRKELEENGIYVANKIFHPSTASSSVELAEIVSAVPTHVNSQRPDSSINAYFYVTSSAISQSDMQKLEKSRVCMITADDKKDTKQYQQENDEYLQKQTVLKQHIDIVIKFLEKDITRLEDKYQNKLDKIAPRLALIKETIQTLRTDFASNALNYNKLIQQLTKLEKQSLPISLLTHTLAEKEIYNTSTTAKEARKLKNIFAEEQDKFFKPKELVQQVMQDHGLSLTKRGK